MRISGFGFLTERGRGGTKLRNDGWKQKKNQGTVAGNKYTRQFGQDV